MNYCPHCRNPVGLLKEHLPICPAIHTGIQEATTANSLPCDAAVLVANKIADEDLYDTGDPVGDMAKVIQAALHGRAEAVRERCAEVVDQWPISTGHLGGLSTAIRALDLTEAPHGRK